MTGATGVTGPFGSEGDPGENGVPQNSYARFAYFGGFAANGSTFFIPFSQGLNNPIIVPTIWGNNIWPDSVQSGGINMVVDDFSGIPGNILTGQFRGFAIGS